MATERRIDVEDTVITRDGLERLTAELKLLRTAGRREIAERLTHVTAGEANRTESVEYQGVRDDQAALEQRIALLEQRLWAVRVVDPQLGNGRIDVGERVRLRDLLTGKRLELELVGPFESNAEAGRISTASPLGRAIVGLRRGQIAEVEAPRGPRRFKVLAVER
jgi:transcription elongation factor GreA